jgi:hypothetical protein
VPPLDDPICCVAYGVHDKEVTLTHAKSMDSGHLVESVCSSDTCLQNLRWVSCGAAGTPLVMTEHDSGEVCPDSVEQRRAYTSPCIRGNCGGSVDHRSTGREKPVAGNLRGDFSGRFRGRLSQAQDGLEIVVAGQRGAQTWMKISLTERLRALYTGAGTIRSDNFVSAPIQTKCMTSKGDSE